ncbi:MAG: hypothetical protein KAT43_03855 [Nanoarchaeota archaeon]|nr:hypothetical protein [Nanoarchaeota archaeon]
MAKKGIPKLTKEQAKEVGKNVGQLDIIESKTSNFISDNIDIAEAIEKEIAEEEKNPETKKEEPVRNKKGRMIFFAIVLIVIFLASYFYFAGNWGTETSEHVEKINKYMYMYDDFEFRQNKDSTWSTEVYNPVLKTIYLVSLHYGPKDLEDIPVTGNVRAWLPYTGNFSGQTNKTVGAAFVLFDPDVNGSIHALAYNELMRNIKRGLQLDSHPALTHNVSENKHGIPVKSCSGTIEPVIWLKHEDPVGISYDGGNCIIVQGTDENIVRAENKLLWLFYSVMES